jgi:hypothetical protein
MRRYFALFCVAACSGLQGCSVFSPIPLWELSKATAAAAGSVIPYGASSSSNTVYHLHPKPPQVCIEGVAGCEVWLRYTASVDWGTPPFGKGMHMYLTRAELTLLTDNGEVLASSQYNLDTVFNWGQWSSTQRKLAPVVTALLTGFDN